MLFTLNWKCPLSLGEEDKKNLIKALNNEIMIIDLLNLDYIKRIYIYGEKIPKF